MNNLKQYDDLSQYKEEWLKNLSFNILLTRECNYRCKHCLMNNYIGEMNISVFKKIIDQLSDMNIKEIILNGGEIFLHSEIKKVFEYLNLKKIEFGFVTNGSMFNEETIKLIKSSNCRFSISLDGPEKFQVKFRNNKNAFSNILNTIALCRKHNLEFGIISSYTKENLKYIDYLINFCLQNGIKYYRLQPVFSEGAAVNLEKQDKLLSDKDLDYLYKRHVELSGINVGRLVIRGLGTFKSQIIQHSCKFGVNYGSSCHSNSLPYPYSIGLTPEGDIYPLSPYLLNLKWKINNILNNPIFDSLEDYYASKLHIELLELHKDVFEKDILRSNNSYIDYGRLIIERMNHL